MRSILLRSWRLEARWQTCLFVNEAARQRATIRAAWGVSFEASAPLPLIPRRPARGQRRGYKAVSGRQSSAHRSEMLRALGYRSRDSTLSRSARPPKWLPVVVAAVAAVLLCCCAAVRCVLWRCGAVRGLHSG